VTKAKTITINNQEYAVDSLSEVAKAQLINLRIVEKEISRLKMQLGIAQTARSVFAKGVLTNLPVLEEK
jgi:hypothetical protein